MDKPEKEPVIFFDKDFMLTGMNTDPRGLDFTISTQEHVINSRDGVLSEKHYYMNYDLITETFTDLAVSCFYTYSTVPGEAAKREEVIQWFFDDGSLGVKKLVVQILETQK